MDFKLKLKINRKSTVPKSVEILGNNLVVGETHLKMKEHFSLILQAINMLKTPMKMSK